MESRNPVFGSSQEFKRGGYATFDARAGQAGTTPAYGTPPMTPGQLEDLYSAPAATPLQTGRMTLDDVVVRTALVFGVLVASAGATFLVVKPPFGYVLIAMAIGFVLAMVNTFKKSPSPALILAYAAVEGVVVGGVSLVYDIRWHGIAAQAVLGTLCAFSAMLALYKTGVIRNSPRFQKTLMIAVGGYLAFALVHLLGIGLGWWSSMYASGGLLAVAISVLGVGLASLFLVLDFDSIERGIANGIPAKFAWTAAFGLVVTLVWLYLEVLRLLAVLRGSN